MNLKGIYTSIILHLALMLSSTLSVVSYFMSVQKFKFGLWLRHKFDIYFNFTWIMRSIPRNDLFLAHTVPFWSIQAENGSKMSPRYFVRYIWIPPFGTDNICQMYNSCHIDSLILTFEKTKTVQVFLQLEVECQIIAINNILKDAQIKLICAHYGTSLV